MRKALGKAAQVAANSGVVHNVATQAADALDQTGAGGRVGGVVSGILRDPGHRESAINVATGVFTPGVRNKFGAAREARSIVNGLRGGGGAVSSGQFGHLPPPPGAGSHSAVPAWDANIPGSGSHYAVPDWDAPPPPRHGGSDTPDWMNPNGEWKTPDY
jgi:hypothetical protein